MKILVVSDMESKFIWDYFDPERFRGVEMILSCGDLSAKYLSFLVTMIPAPLFYVPGNHDKSYAKNPPEGCVNIDGRLIEYRGLRIMGFGGCKSNRSTTHEYTDKQMWRKIKKMNFALKRTKGFDIFVTHAPAKGLGDGGDFFHEGFEAFRFVLDTYQPKIHFYGHRHLCSSPVDRKAIYPYENTLMVNACGYKIIDVDPAMEPWIPPAPFAPPPPPPGPPPGPFELK